MSPPSGTEPRAAFTFTAELKFVIQLLRSTVPRALPTM